MSFFRDMFADSGTDADRAGLGFFETEANAQAARLAVQTLDNTFEQAGSPAKYKAQVDAIDASWKAWDDSIVFYTFSQAVAIGQRAQALTQQIATENGLTAPTADPNLNQTTATQLADTLKVAAQIVTGVAVASAASKLWELAKPAATVKSGTPPIVRRRRRRA